MVVLWLLSPCALISQQLLLQLISFDLSMACAIPIKITKPKLHDQGKTPVLEIIVQYLEILKKI